MEIFWIHHAAFKIRTNSGKVIILDPYEIHEEEKADIIISSHEHGDHFDPESIKKIIKESTIILGPVSISAKLKEFNGKGLNYYEPYEINGIKIELVPAYNIKRKRETGEPFHPKEKNWAGIIIEVDGKKVYHAGDTERIPEMKDLNSKNIDVALLPCGGTYTMDFQESTDAALDINPKIVVPMHNWDKNMKEYIDILAKKDPNIQVEILSEKSLKF